jgi:phosphatidylserine/phosphatidylglycerophosphate/cardiolipin synthase-like enzyme
VSRPHLRRDLAPAGHPFSARLGRGKPGRLVLAVVFGLLFGGCSSTATGDAADHDAGPDTAPASAWLEIHAMDLWAQYLPPEAELRVHREGTVVEAQGFPLARVPLRDPGRYHIALSAPDHESVDLELDYDGSRDPEGLQGVAFSAPNSSGVAMARPPILSGPPVHQVFLGLRHRWLSASGPAARRGNEVTLLMDGEEAYDHVHADLVAATERIHIATWWWESDFELVRPPGHETMTREERETNTILSVLQRSPALKRVLVGQFISQDGLLSWLTTDAALRAHGADPDDDFELMGQANETSGTFLFEIQPFWFGDRLRAQYPELDASLLDPFEIASTIPPRLVDLTEIPLGLEVNHASYHQKFFIIDSTIAYVGGMNLRRTDWDTSEHRVFEPRRMLFSSSPSRRLAVADRDRLPDLPPRKDYMVRVRGPAVADVDDVFHRRWELLRSQGVTYADNTTAIEVEPAPAALTDGVQAQITTTLPAPFWEHSIAESWLNAIANAERYILIEDQYFRAPMLTRAIVERMHQVPDLRLVVITSPINEWTDPGCYQTYRADQAIRAVFPSRYLLLRLRSFDYVETWGWNETEARFVDIDTHSKMIIVDDVFASVGSANKNNRGMLYEAEMNVAVFDRDWVRDARRRILGSILPPGTPTHDDPAVWWDQLVAASEHNGWVESNWDAQGGDISLNGAPLPPEYTPHGKVYPLVFRAPRHCLIEGIGEDIFAPPPPPPPRSGAAGTAPYSGADITNR